MTLRTSALLRVDDKDGADCESDALLCCVVKILLVDHVVQEGNFSVVVGNDGERKVGVCDLVDVLDPALVRAKIVGALYPLSVLFQFPKRFQLRTRPIILTPRASNSFFSLAKAPSSVVHTGV
jgi:hypothetical protein